MLPERSAASDWPPLLSPNASWREVVGVQLAPWRRRGIHVDRLLARTKRLRDNASPVGSHSYAAPSVAVLISTSDWSMAKLGGAWKAHHTERSRALVALLKLAQRRVVREGRPPLPPIRLVHVVTDGHGVVDAGFNASCTCKSQATCCDPRRRRSAEPPDAPAWAAVACAFSWDVSVPWALHTFTDVGSEGALDRGARQYTRMAAGAPWERRERKAFHVGDRKAWL